MLFGLLVFGIENIRFLWLLVFFFIDRLIERKLFMEV